ncbi:MAG TPA: ferric iron uptake transcriptional regulator, partial [Gammaproteobacteria bacterium]|nr:ferric iron uptake transcriptional regulator [Gammaproteobacteria bacterium]
MPEDDLKKAGLKVTLPRLKILNILESSARKHMSAEEIYKIFIERGDEIGIATV